MDRLASGWCVDVWLFLQVSEVATANGKFRFCFPSISSRFLYRKKWCPEQSCCFCARPTLSLSLSLCFVFSFSLFLSFSLSLFLSFSLSLSLSLSLSPLLSLHHSISSLNVGTLGGIARGACVWTGHKLWLLQQPWLCGKCDSSVHGSCSLSCRPCCCCDCHRMSPLHGLFFVCRGMSQAKPRPSSFSPSTTSRGPYCLLTLPSVMTMSVLALPPI